jgi:hypothetical protein
MKSRTTLHLVGLLLLVLTGQLAALEVSAGRLKLVLHQGIGRFSLYADGIPLFVDQDPRTSGLSMVVDNKVYRLGETSEFRETAETLAEGARFTWTSQRLTVTESFSFTSNSSLLIAVTITNTSERDMSVGLRLFLDTYLGEESYPHFQTDLQPQINGELTLNRGNMPSYWLSASLAPRKPAGLLCLLRGPQTTEPDQVMFGNWKRMSEAVWTYETSAARNFSDLPYSINDSGVFHYYNVLPLARAGSRTVNIALQATQAGEQGFEPKALQQQPAAEETQVAPESLSVRGDLRLLNGLLQELERKLSSRTAFSEEELRLMGQILAEIKNRLETTGR